jgi:hypothetical protein
MMAGAAILALAATACIAGPTPSPSASPPPTPTEVPTPSPPPSERPSAAGSPSPTPEPSLSLDLPEQQDARVVEVEILPNVAVDGDGEIVVTVTSTADSRIDELVLRWPAELNDALVLAPFTPSEDRIRDLGPPLVQPWTKWVVGPGERGEPEGTISLGWGPLLPAATLEIPIVVTRTAPGPVAFDLQVLAGNDVLTLEDGAPAVFRVEVP